MTRIRASLLLRRRLLLVGPQCRQQLGEPPLGHLEDGQGLDEEFGCRLSDLLQLLGAPMGPEDVQEHAVMNAGQIEDAQLLADRPASKFVGRLAARFTTLGKVLQKGGSVVAPEPLVGISGHGAPFRGRRWRYARPSSRARAGGTL